MGKDLRAWPSPLISQVKAAGAGGSPHTPQDVEVTGEKAQKYGVVIFLFSIFWFFESCGGRNKDRVWDWFLVVAFKNHENSRGSFKKI